MEYITESQGHQYLGDLSNLENVFDGTTENISQTVVSNSDSTIHYSFQNSHPYNKNVKCGYVNGQKLKCPKLYYILNIG